jgi:glutamyl/glutaminyl-tRNA synthetase
VETNCPECGKTVIGAGSVQASLATMRDVPKDVKVVTDDGLTIELRPVTYETTIAAGVSNFQNARSMQSIANIDDDMEKLKAFNDSYMKMAELNFLVILDSIYSISGMDAQDEEFIVTDRDNIREYMENCASDVGKKVTEHVNKLGEAGIDKTIKIQCQEEECGHIFETNLEFDPVNFSTAS